MGIARLNGNSAIEWEWRGRCVEEMAQAAVSSLGKGLASFGFEL